MKPRPGMRFAFFLVPFSGVLLAASPSGQSPDDLIRRANAAFAAGERDEADRLYAAAGERTSDPGLVAFNRAAVLFAEGEFREAEVSYARVLDDAACPPHRAARAWYNRGTCLLRRGGSAVVYRSAIACLERCLDADAADAPLKADARHNLELAKVLWNEARKKESKEDRPNANPPPEDPRSDPPPPPSGTEPKAGDRDKTNGTGTPQATPAGQPATTDKPTGQPNGPEGPAPGVAGPAPQLKNESAVQALSPEDARAHLRTLAGLLKKDRQDLLREVYPEEQPGGLDR